MINEEELRIANTSYTNKDFISIYPELLELAKKISPKWDPSVSNESDPGNVLLKLLAFIGDKVNYNSDKNVLECYMPSATQETSMRNLCEMNGYFPKYYESAETTVSFRYDGHSIDDGSSFTLPAFTTVVSDEDGEISYSLISPVTISQRKKIFTGKAMQGTFERLTIGDKDKIQLSDLDDNNRIYLPEVMIAQNGIFIYNVDYDLIINADTSDDGASWKRVDNLNLIEPSNNGYYFKVGFDSTMGFPYIEFPSNIADLIESGLTIIYCKTKGISGNISANTLTKLVAPLQITTNESSDTTIDFSVSEDATTESTDEGTLVIKNTSSTINGSDPETINEAYNNFKKTVGTFTTLTTCRDYANAIYNMVNEETGYHYVSNIQVADRRNDINYGNSIVTFSSLGKTVVSLNTDDSVITPYELCLYPLKPMLDSYTYENYAASFRPLYDTVLIKQDLQDLKTISHNYKNISSSDVWALKNYYKLNAIITTTYKVNEYEQNSIKDSINYALFKAFNGRQVDYGYEIPFDSILEVIQKSDARIKNVSLEEPVLRTMVMRGNGTETQLMEYTNSVRQDYLTMLAKNILAGRLSLFNYDEDFDYDFGFSRPSTTVLPSGKGPKFVNIYQLETGTTIKQANEGSGTAIIKGYGEGYTLRENEVVQLVAPNLSSKITYPAYTNFRFEKNSGAGTACIIATGPITTARSDFDTKQALPETTSGGVPQWYYSRVPNTVISPAVGKLVDSNGYLYAKATSNASPNNPLYTLSSFGSLTKYISANTEYLIQPNEKLIIQYTDSNSVSHYIEYCNDGIIDNGVKTLQSKVIVKPNFDVYPVTVYKVSGRSIVSKETTTGTLDFYTLATNETIEERQIVSRIINDNQLYCYWSVDNLNNQLFSALTITYKEVANYTTFTTTSMYVNYYVYYNNTYTLVTSSNKDSLGIVPGTTKAYEFSHHERLLGDNEYFAYCDDAKTELVILGSGTQIKYYGEISNYSDWICDKNLISKLTNNGLSVFEDFNWKIKSFNVNNLEVCDMQILTLVKDDMIQISSDYTADIVNTFKELNSNTTVNYTSNGERATLPTFSFLKWKIHSRLDLNCGPKLRQELLKNQHITIYYCSSYTVDPITGKITSRTGENSVTVTKDGSYNTYIELNLLKTGTPGGVIDTKVTEISTTDTVESLALKAYVFNYAAPTYIIVENGEDKTVQFTRIGDYANIDLSALKNVKTSTKGTINLPIMNVGTNTRLIMMYLNCNELSSMNVHLLATANSGEGIRFYNNPTSSVTTDLELRATPGSGETGTTSKLFIIELVGTSISQLTLKAQMNSTDSNVVNIIIGTVSQVITRVDGGNTLKLNKIFNISSAEETALLTILRTKDTDYQFYYNMIPDKASLIDTKDTTKPSIFWDRNNIYNKITIGEIDFSKDSMSIEIAKSSQL